jgi:hypothetical protein
MAKDQLDFFGGDGVYGEEEPRRLGCIGRDESGKCGN